MSLKDIESINNKSSFYKLCRNNANHGTIYANLLDTSFADRLNISDDEIAKIITNPISYYYRFDNPTWTYAINMAYLCLNRKDELPDNVIRAIYELLHSRAEDAFGNFLHTAEKVRENNRYNINIEKLVKLYLEEYEIRTKASDNVGYEMKDRRNLRTNLLIARCMLCVEDIFKYDSAMELYCAYIRVNFEVDNRHPHPLDIAFMDSHITEDIVRRCMKSNKKHVVFAALYFAIKKYDFLIFEILTDIVYRFPEEEKQEMYFRYDYDCHIMVKIRNILANDFTIKDKDDKVLHLLFMEGLVKSRSKILSFLGVEVFNRIEAVNKIERYPSSSTELLMRRIDMRTFEPPAVVFAVGSHLSIYDNIFNNNTKNEIRVIQLTIPPDADIIGWNGQACKADKAFVTNAFRVYADGDKCIVEETALRSMGGYDSVYYDINQMTEHKGFKLLTSDINELNGIRFFCTAEEALRDIKNRLKEWRCISKESLETILENVDFNEFYKSRNLKE